MSSISRAHLSWITASRSASDASAPSARAVTSCTDPTASIDGDACVPCSLVPVEHGRRLPLVDREPIADRLGLVVLATHQRAAALVARAARLAPRVRRLAVLADRAAAQAPHDLVVVDVEAEHRVDLRAQLRSTARALRPAAPCARRRRASRRSRTRGSPSASLMMPRMTASGTRSPRSMYALASSPSGVPSRIAARSTSPVASVGTPSAAASSGAWVPFPAPGFPKRTMIIGGMVQVNVGGCVDADRLQRLEPAGRLTGGRGT